MMARSFRSFIASRAPRRIVAALSMLAAWGCSSGPGRRSAGPTGSPGSARLAAEVRSEIARCWRGYEEHARGHDELKPVSGGFRDWYGESLLMTPVDALDTLLLAGLPEESARAKALVLERLSFDRDVTVKNFEVTIRLLGGLLSSFQLTGDRRLLALADDLGRRLLPVFASPTGMPYMFVNLKTGKASGARSNPAEIGTLLLEFGTLSKLTGNPVYLEKARRAVTVLYARRSPIGLVGEEIDVETGEWKSAASHVGGGIDSYYEYLAKSARLFGDAELERMWRESRKAVDAHLADQAASGLWYGQADMTSGQRTATEFGALQSFLPALLAFDGDLGRARRLEESCFRMWTLHGIEPEALDYSSMKVTEAGYPLRPEIVESAYYLYRYTKDPRYLDMGRVIFADLEKYCGVENGYTVLKSVVTKERGDLMPSYFLAETLKYLYLLFSPEDAADFEHVVFNTEAHPLRRTW
jgi:ER degradation enhancer, mannosidase alpha-like 2